MSTFHRGYLKRFIFTYVLAAVIFSIGFAVPVFNLSRRAVSPIQNDEVSTVSSSSAILMKNCHQKLFKRNTDDVESFTRTPSAESGIYGKPPSSSSLSSSPFTSNLLQQKGSMNSKKPGTMKNPCDRKMEYAINMFNKLGIEKNNSVLTPASSIGSNEPEFENS